MENIEASQLIAPWVRLFLLLIPLMVTERWIHRHSFGIGYLLSNKNKVSATRLFYVFFAPGIFVHEAVQYLVAGAVNVPLKPLDLQIKEQDDGTIRFDFVVVDREKADPLRPALVSAAPFLVMSVIVWFISTQRLRLDALTASLGSGDLRVISAGVESLLATPDFILWFYLLFVVANTMVPKREDAQGWPIILGVLALLGAALTVLGLGNVVVETFAGPVTEALNLINSAILAILVMNVAAIMMLGLTEDTIERIRGEKMNYSGEGEMSQKTDRTREPGSDVPIPKGEPLPTVYGINLPLPKPDDITPKEKQPTLPIRSPAPVGMSAASGDAEQPLARPSLGDGPVRAFQERQQPGERGAQQRPFQERQQPGERGTQQRPFQERQQQSERGAQQRPFQERQQPGERGTTQQRPFQERQQPGERPSLRAREVEEPSAPGPVGGRPAESPSARDRIPRRDGDKNRPARPPAGGERPARPPAGGQSERDQLFRRGDTGSDDRPARPSGARPPAGGERPARPPAGGQSERDQLFRRGDTGSDDRPARPSGARPPAGGERPARPPAGGQSERDQLFRRGDTGSEDRPARPSGARPPAGGQSERDQLFRRGDTGSDDRPARPSGARPPAGGERPARPPAGGQSERDQLFRRGDTGSEDRPARPSGARPPAGGERPARPPAGGQSERDQLFRRGDTGSDDRPARPSGARPPAGGERPARPPAGGQSERDQLFRRGDTGSDDRPARPSGARPPARENRPPQPAPRDRLFRRDVPPPEDSDDDADDVVYEDFDDV